MAEDYDGGYDLEDVGGIIDHGTFPVYIYLQGTWYRKEEEDGPLFVMHPAEVVDLMNQLEKN